MKDGIVLLGRRRGAVAAAKRLGLSPLVVTDGIAADDADRRRWARPLRDESALLDLGPLLSAAARVRAVVATTEGSVVAAARLRAILELPGMDVETASCFTDKARMKATVSARGIACAAFVTAEAGADRGELVRRLGLPMVLKNRASSGRRGMRLAEREADVPEELAHGRMAESFVTGREMSFESLVVDGEPVFENPTEYLRPGWANVVPADLSPGVRSAVRALNRRVLAALGMRNGLTHLEVFVDGDDVIFGEIAARPPGGHLMRLIELAYGFDPWEALLRVACGETPHVEANAAQAAAVWLLHPGRGRVTRVAGVAEARALPGVVELPLRVEVGDDVDARLGVGQEVGHVIVTGRDRDEAAARVTAARDLVQLEVA